MALKNFNMPKVHPHKAAIASGLKFVGGLPQLSLVPHVNGRLKVLHGGNWVGTIIPKELDDGDEGFFADYDYELLSMEEVCQEWHGDAGMVARLLSVLQQSNGSWDAVAEAY